MGCYFDYSDWDLDELCTSIRERIKESKKPIPPKVKVRYISILYRTGENCYTYNNNIGYYYTHADFKTVKEAEDYLNSITWLKRTDENTWEEIPTRETYINKEGKKVNCHYEIRESDSWEYEDGESYIEYSEEEKEKLSEALYMIEKARIYMQVYDHCCDQWCFGKGGFSDELKKELNSFEKTYTEELTDTEEYE